MASNIRSMVPCPCLFCHGKLVSIYVRRQHAKQFSSLSQPSLQFALVDQFVGDRSGSDAGPQTELTPVECWHNSNDMMAGTSCASQLQVCIYIATCS